MEHDGDPLLLALASLVESSGTSLGVTVAVGGVLLSGSMVPSREYAAATENDLGFVLTEDRDPDDDANGESITRPGFVHIRILRPVPSEGAFEPDGQLWRCRVSRIDGWSLTPLGIESVAVGSAAVSGETLLGAASGLG